MFFVYVLQSLKDKKLYIGYTDNLAERFKKHNDGQVKSTNPLKPFKIIYYEAHQNKYDAIVKEKFLKTGWGYNYLKRSLKNYFEAKT